MSTQEAVDKALEEYWDTLRKYTLPHGRPGYEMFEQIERLVKRDSHLIAEVVDRELNKDKEEPEQVGVFRCKFCERVIDKRNFKSHMSVIHQFEVSGEFVPPEPDLTVDIPQKLKDGDVFDQYISNWMEENLEEFVNAWWKKSWGEAFGGSRE